MPWKPTPADWTKVRKPKIGDIVGVIHQGGIHQCTKRDPHWGVITEIAWHHKVSKWSRTLETRYDLLPCWVYVTVFKPSSRIARYPGREWNFGNRPLYADITHYIHPKFEDLPEDVRLAYVKYRLSQAA